MPTGNERFLELLDSDPQEAEKYLGLRKKLVFYFQHNGCADSENLADEVFSRALRRNTEPTDFHAGISAYCFGIAEYVLLEDRRRPKPGELSAEIPETSPADTLGLNPIEQRVLVQQCLQGLPKTNGRFYCVTIARTALNSPGNSRLLRTGCAFAFSESSASWRRAVSAAPAPRVEAVEMIVSVAPYESEKGTSCATPSMRWKGGH